jgi:hypothetical protein
MTLRCKTLIWIVLASAMLILTGCTNPFRPKLRHEETTGVSNKTPIDVLNNLELAYTQKNLELYKSVLAEDFRFELISSEVDLIGIDVNNDGITDSWWGLEKELEFTDNLFNFGSSDGTYPPPDQIVLRLNVPPQELWELDPEVGHENWVVIPCGFDLQLQFNTISSSLAASGIARFYLRPQNNRWQIVIWRDESNL